MNSSKLSQSQSTQSHSRRGNRSTQNDTLSQSQIHIPQEELREFTKNMIKYILNLSISKIPIKKNDLVKNVLAGNAKAFAQVTAKAFGQLKCIYGYKIVEVEVVRPITYICVSVVPAGSEFDFVEDYRVDNTFLFLILSYIYMKNGSVYETSLYNFLEKLDILEKIEHDYFNNVRKKIDLYIKQLYIKKEKETVEGMHEEKVKFSWGFRAIHEFAKRDVLDLVCKLLNKPAIGFTLQYSEAYGVNENEGSPTPTQIE